MKKIICALFCAVLLGSCNSQPAAQQSDAKKSVPAAKTSLRMNYSGSGAVEWKFDGKNIGTNKMSVVKTTVGKHQIEIKDAAGNWNKFAVDAGTDVTMISLGDQNGRIESLYKGAKAADKKLIITSEPYGANVFINRQAMGNTPVAIALVSPDKDLEISLTHGDYDLTVKNINIARDGAKHHIVMRPLGEGEKSKTFVRPSTALSIDAPDSPGSKIYINRIDINRVTPQKEIKLPIGTYVIGLERPADKVRFEFKVELVDGQSYELVENLQGRVPADVPGIGKADKNFNVEEMLKENDHDHEHHHHH